MIYQVPLFMFIGIALALQPKIAVLFAVLMMVRLFTRSM